MSDFNLSKVDIPLRSKSMSNHDIPKMDIISIKQIGDYILGEEIGSGAFGKVLLGKHILTGEKVAIKILDKMILNQNPEDYELVKKEISILKLVKHKYIVQLYEILQTAQHIFIIMEYCEGKEILDYILTKNRLNELESLKYFQQLINCLFYLHSQNIAHRDIKIDNMLLDINKDLKLIDFGLSTKYSDDDLLDQPCGTVVYAAPEVLEGKEYHGMLADVWSSGIVLYGMLAGYLPFSEKNDEENKKLVIKGQITMPDFFSDKVKDLLKHMLDVNPMTRYTLQEIKDHPWFNTVDCLLIPGIIIDYNIIPIDEKIIDICVTYNKDKNNVINSIKNNKYDSNSALYYLLIKKLQKKGIKSISDMCSDEFIDFVLDENNLINKENNNNKEETSIEILNEKSNDNLIETNQNIDSREVVDCKIEEKKKILNEKGEDIPEKYNYKERADKKKEATNHDKEIILFSSDEKINEGDTKNVETTEELKNTSSPMSKKNYDIDESYQNKDNKFEINDKITEKNSEKLMVKENEEEINKFDVKETLINKNENSSKQIDLEDEKRFKTDINNNNNKIIEKMMDNLENNMKRIKILDIDFSDIINEDNSKDKINLAIKEDKVLLNEMDHLRENDESLTKYNNSKILINNDKNKISKKIEDKNIEIGEISGNKYKKIIKNEENQDNLKDKNPKLNIKTKEKIKRFDKNKEKINTKIKQLSNTTKKNLYFTEKSNKVLKQLKKNLTKQKYITTMSPITEIKTAKKKSKFRLETNKRFYNVNTNKKNYNFSSRNSKNKYILINEKIKSKQKLIYKNNNISNIKRKTSNKIFNIINIINNNFNSTGSEIKMKNYYLSPQNNKENINIINLQKKFDEISVQHIKEINYNNQNFSSDKTIFKKDKEINSAKINNRVNTKTNNITIIIQNKKEINKNSLDGNLLKSIINIGNKKINNLNHSKSKQNHTEINNYKKNIRTKNLESSVKGDRYKSPYGIRELSESPKQKYLNNKARLTRIPWKIKKNGIDKKMDSKQIYEQYKFKMKKPFTQNNSKIVNINKSVKSSFSNSIRSSLCDTKKINKSSFANNIREIKSNYAYPKNIKQFKKNIISKKDHKIIEKIENNSKIRDNPILNSDIKVKNINQSYLDIKKSSEKFIPNNALSENLKKIFSKSKPEISNTYVPLNLCCLYFNKNGINNYKNYLIYELKKNSISFIQKKNNSFVCNKNGYNCEIHINKININNKSPLLEFRSKENILSEKEINNLYYLKIYGKKEFFGINNIFKKFVLNLDK